MKVTAYEDGHGDVCFDLSPAQRRRLTARPVGPAWTNTYQDIADRWLGEKCTLDGKPAEVIGRLCQFAGIALLADPATVVRVSWPRVQRIMQSTKAFRS